MSDVLMTLIAEKEQAEQEAQRQKQRAEAAERELTRLRAAVGDENIRDTLRPDEDTGPLHPDPMAEMCIAIDNNSNSIRELKFAFGKFVERFSGVEAAVASRPPWVDDILEIGQRVIVLEDWKRRITLRPSTCPDCPLRAEGVGGE